MMVRMMNLKVRMLQRPENILTTLNHPGLHLLACFQTKRMIMEKRKYRNPVSEV